MRVVALVVALLVMSIGVAVAAEKMPDTSGWELVEVGGDICEFGTKQVTVIVEVYDTGNDEELEAGVYYVAEDSETGEHERAEVPFAIVMFDADQEFVKLLLDLDRDGIIDEEFTSEEEASKKYETTCDAVKEVK